MIEDELIWRAIAGERRGRRAMVVGDGGHGDGWLAGWRAWWSTASLVLHVARAAGELVRMGAAREWEGRSRDKGGSPGLQYSERLLHCRRAR